MLMYKPLLRLLKAVFTLLQGLYTAVCGIGDNASYQQLADEALEAPVARHTALQLPEQQMALLKEPRLPPEHALEAPSASTILVVDGEPSKTSISQTVIVMRHGHRQDEQQRSWTDTAERPWDPPLSEKGRAQAKMAGARWKGAGIDYVVASPFVRCLQTSAEIVAQLDLPQGHWLVDWSVCEVLDPRLLFALCSEVQAVTSGRSVDAWMWGGTPAQQAVAEFAAAERALGSNVKISPELCSSVSPLYPERLEGALMRYNQGIKSVMETYEGKNVLVVTHGEAVRAALNMALPNATVYEVQHTSYLPLNRTRDVGQWGVWRLGAGSGETGVQWYED